MNMIEGKERLHQLIDEIMDSSTIATLTEIAEDLKERQEADSFVLTDRHKEILDERIRKYRSGNGEWHAWEDIVAGQENSDK